MVPSLAEKEWWCWQSQANLSPPNFPLRHPSARPWMSAPCSPPGVEPDRPRRALHPLSPTGMFRVPTAQAGALKFRLFIPPFSGRSTRLPRRPVAPTSKRCGDRCSKVRSKCVSTSRPTISAPCSPPGVEPDRPRRALHPLSPRGMFRVQPRKRGVDEPSSIYTRFLGQIDKAAEAYTHKPAGRPTPAQNEPGSLLTQANRITDQPLAIRTIGPQIAAPLPGR